MNTNTRKEDSPPLARKRIGRLKTPSDVARFMAKCIKEAARGEGTGTKFYNLVNMSSQLLKALEVSELERRIEELERKANLK